MSTRIVNPCTTFGACTNDTMTDVLIMNNQRHARFRSKVEHIYQQIIQQYKLKERTSRTIQTIEETNKQTQYQIKKFTLHRKKIYNCYLKCRRNEYFVKSHESMFTNASDMMGMRQYLPSSSSTNVNNVTMDRFHRQMENLDNCITSFQYEIEQRQSDKKSALLHFDKELHHFIQEMKIQRYVNQGIHSDRLCVSDQQLEVVIKKFFSVDTKDKKRKRKVLFRRYQTLRG
jgi:hypothetical protein